MNRIYIYEKLVEEIEKTAESHKEKGLSHVSIYDIKMSITVSYTFDNEPVYHLNSISHEFTGSG